MKRVRATTLEFEHKHYRARCTPWGHRFENDGIVVFTARRREVWKTRRSMIDDEAQRFLGWRKSWIERVGPPKKWRSRVDIRPAHIYQGGPVFAVRRTGSRAIIGGVFFRRDATGNPGLGMALSPEERSQGLGRKTLELLLAIGHRHLGYATISMLTDTDNVAFQRLAESLGFTAYETSEHTYPDGRRVVEVRYLSVDDQPVLACAAGAFHAQ